MNRPTKTISNFALGTLLLSIPFSVSANAALAILIVSAPFAVLSLFPLAFFESTIIFNSLKQIKTVFSFSRLYWIMFLANFVSYAAGVSLWGSNQRTSWMILLPITFVMSAMIEGAILFLFMRKKTKGLNLSFAAAFLANSLSYLAIALLLMISLLFRT